jgi:hypothetical protein
LPLEYGFEFSILAEVGTDITGRRSAISLGKYLQISPTRRRVWSGSMNDDDPVAKIDIFA